MLKTEINNYVDTNWASVSSVGLAWDALKAVIRGRVIQYASFYKKLKEKEISELENNIKKAETKMKRHTTPSGLRELTQLKYRYNNILSQKMEFLLFRARQTYFESGDKAGKLLANYIKHKESSTIIAAVRAPGGEFFTAATDINKQFKDFYIDLYKSTSSSTNEEISDFLEPLDLPQLSSEQKEFLDLDITLEEIMEVIKALPTGKAPGPDGFVAEFFKDLVSELAPLMLEVFMEALQRGELPQTMSQAVISLILKKDKDASDCKSYRPISLIQLDTKILSKILANRLNKVISSLIHVDQVGFIIGRSSSDNIRRFIDIWWSVMEEQIPIAAISLDAEKAFDMVEWHYLFKILEVYGFGNTFIRWIKLLYKQPLATVQTNGLMSEYFSLGRGTRQGCPLSPLLFCLALEPLAASIRKNSDFPGVIAGGEVHKLMLYADDILLFVSDPSRSIPCLLRTIDSFSKFSGYRVNWSKTEALALTAFCPSTAFHPGIFQWPKLGLRYLGILFPPDFKELVRVNFDPLMKKISCDMERWAPLLLSLAGKVNVIKMSCTPKLNYLLQSLPIQIPLSYFKQFDRICKNFIWNGKRPRLHSNKLQRPVEKGGLGLPNVLYYYYAFSLRHLAHWSLPPERAPPWYKIEQSALPSISLLQSISIKLVGKVKKHPIISHLNAIWLKISRLHSFNPYLNVSSSIWLNPKLCINKAPFLWKDWAKKGLVNLGDLYENGSLKSFECIQQQYNVPRSQFFRYLQLRHLLCETFGSTTQLPELADAHCRIFSLYGKGHEASMYYSWLIQNIGEANSQALKKIWERDLNIILDDKEWQGILKNAKMASRDARIRLIQFKIVHRFYWTPSRLFKLGLKDTPLCWRCKAETGDLAHALWSCIKVQDFWKRVQEHICLILDLQVLLCPKLFILGGWINNDIINAGTKSWIQTSLLIGRQIILRSWKSEDAPSFQEWVAELSRVAAYEKMSYKQRDNLKLYFKKWSKYLIYLEVEHVNSMF